ncbi:MAG: YncE family protein, partial [Phycisphaeraceae bacterium]|nr:YncE family protein [Phycisphaeraceae bacterium]
YPAHARLMIVGNDGRISWNAKGEQLKFLDTSKDSVCILDITTNPEAPKIVATLPMINSIYGPPTNLIITPDETLGLVANPMKVKRVAGELAVVPDNLLHLIDLEGKPRLIKTITVGQQPSGMDLSTNGSLLLIANRAGQSVSVLSVKGKSVKLMDTVHIGVPVADVAIAPDGRRALIVLKQDNKIGILNIRGLMVTYDKTLDINVGISPYNVEISPNGQIALVANSGVTGGNDGNTDTVSVIDLTAPRPHVINAIGVGDGPEGLAISPTGDLAAVVLINGSQNAQADPNTAWAANKNGRVAMLSIRGKKVRKIADIEVGAMPEGVVFSPNGQYIYVGNFLSDDISILKVKGRKIVNTGIRLALPGSPAAMRGPK